MRAAGATTVVMREFEGLLRAWSIRGFVCRDLGRARERMGALRVFFCVFERETLDVTDENGCVARVWWAPVPRLAFKCVCMERAAG